VFPSCFIFTKCLPIGLSIVELCKIRQAQIRGGASCRTRRRFLAGPGGGRVNLRALWRSVLSPGRQSAIMSKITNDGLTQLSRTHSHYARCRTLTRDNARHRAWALTYTCVQNAEIESGSNSASYCVRLDAVWRWPTHRTTISRGICELRQRASSHVTARWCAMPRVDAEPLSQRQRALSRVVWV